MLTGKRFQLGRETLALDVVDGKRALVALAVDLDTRGTEINDVSARTSSRVLACAAQAPGVRRLGRFELHPLGPERDCIQFG